jgi:triphosphatase
LAICTHQQASADARSRPWTIFNQTVIFGRPSPAAGICMTTNVSIIASHRGQASTETTAPAGTKEDSMRSQQPAHDAKIVDLRRETARMVDTTPTLPEVVQPPRDEALSIELRAILRTCRNDLLAYRDIVLTGREPIGIHQSRVALRRMRAALSLFRQPLGDAAPRDLGAPAKELASACGPCRDWDVLIADTLPEALTALRRHIDADKRDKLERRAAALLRSARQLRRNRHDAARRALGGEEFATFDSLLASVIDEPGPALSNPEDVAVPLRAFAREALEKRDRKVRKLGRHLDTLSFEEKHALRVRLKKLRYAASFLRHVFDDARAEEYIRAAAGLQEAFGALNDRAVAEDLLDQAMTVARPRGVHDWLAGALAGWLTAETQRREERLDKAWKRFRKVERFWRDEAEA